MIRYLFIHLEVKDGERTHNHRVLHTTRAKDLNFAVERYVSTFWGFGKVDKQSRWWDYGECAGRLKSFTEISREDYEMLNYLFN